MGVFNDGMGRTFATADDVPEIWFRELPPKAQWRTPEAQGCWWPFALEAMGERDANPAPELEDRNSPRLIAARRQQMADWLSSHRDDLQMGGQELADNPREANYPAEYDLPPVAVEARR